MPRARTKEHTPVRTFVAATVRKIRKHKTGISLAAVLSVLTFVTGVIPKMIRAAGDYIYRDSETSVRVARVSDQAIYLFVSNSGRKKESILSDCTLDFGEVPIEAAALEPILADEKKTVIAPGQTVIIRYTSRGLTLKHTGRPDLSQGGFVPITKADVLSQLSTRTGTLLVKVEESNDPHRVLPPIHVPLDRMRGFIKDRIEDDVHF
jgi:hypothetical protein